MVVLGDGLCLKRLVGGSGFFFHFGFILLVTVHVKLSAFPFYQLCYKHSSYLWLGSIGTMQINFS